MPQADEEVAAAMEGVRGRSTQCTHLQYVLEAGLLYSKDGQGQYPIDLLNKCPIKGNAGRAAARIRQSMYLQYAGRLGALCKKDAPIAPLGLLLAVGASSSYREAGELINQYRAARKSGGSHATAAWVSGVGWALAFTGDMQPQWCFPSAKNVLFT
ncbi:hypothetical protein Agub_g3396 [Astrephomene gubernaculifera]|uniref:Uncharacterized protein n=1 Tax=Astrephomene gubernaculifera TaxID=47775 RepID=A0AAD3DKL3_9CHLO|nr:hypothetical protein Agub_g3396 [Astrephomene gubernaculifera]